MTFKIGPIVFTTRDEWERMVESSDEEMYEALANCMAENNTLRRLLRNQQSAGAELAREDHQLVGEPVMVNRSKAVGSWWETDIVNYLKREGFPSIEWVRQRGVKDLGDVHIRHAGRLIVVEAKREKLITLSTYVDEANRECENAEGFVGVAWHHRPRRGSPADAYVTMAGSSLVKLVKALGGEGTDREHT